MNMRYYALICANMRYYALLCAIMRYYALLCASPACTDAACLTGFEVFLVLTNIIESNILSCKGC
jgi:hypothetical protein